MKKALLFLALVFAFYTHTFATPSSCVEQYTLENGLTVFLLEDTSSPFIRLEYACKAGFSSQTQNSNGFFKLYSKVLKNSMPTLDFEVADCFSDSSRYALTITPSKLEATFSLLAQQAFSPNFSNELISTQLNELKKETSQNASSLSTLINAAIDSKVFASSPWKHDSGLYAPLFSKTTVEQARTLLFEISQRYYTPQNSAIFVSGNINKTQILSLIQNTFGSYYSTYKVPYQKEEKITNTQKKYVIHDPEFSSEMTQIVVQYTNCSSYEDCAIASSILNNNSSFFKYNLLNEAQLNIPGDEYINVSVANKKGENRIIIQSLLQQPQDKTLAKNTNSLHQALLFLKQTKTGINQMTSGEFSHFQNQLIFDMKFLETNPTVFMEQLSLWWAVDVYTQPSENILDAKNSSTITQNFLDKKIRLQNSTLENVSSQFSGEEPFLFVLISSSDYKKHEKDYKTAGFEVITKQNASWYNQPSFENVKSLTDENIDDDFSAISYENDYYEKNKNQIKSQKLINGIPLYTKHNENSSQITLMLSIRGGKLNSSNNNGFEQVMVNLLATNIQKDIFEQAQNGKILGLPNVTCNTSLATSTITLECEKEDFEVCLKSISNALIMGEIIPAVADRAVSNAQYQKRLENGSVTYQMYCAAIETLYKNSSLSRIFNCKDEILENTSYTQILQEYPKLLDSSRYSIILTGNFSDNAQKLLNETIGLLANQNGMVNYSTVTTKMPKNKNVNVKLNHTFLTDVPAEKAGPMPAVLIPTKEFIDPVVYVFNEDEKGTKGAAIFTALLYYIEDELNREIENNGLLSGAKAYATSAYSSMNAATITIQNVAHIRAMDSLFNSVIEKLNLQLKEAQNVTLITKIKDTWISKVLEQTKTNTGTAHLMQQGLEYFPYEQNPLLYLEEYNFIQNAQVADFIHAMNNFPAKPSLSLYSKDGKK